MKLDKRLPAHITLVFLLTSVSLAACGGRDDGEGDTEADRLGVAAMCDEDADCPKVEVGDEVIQLKCLVQFDSGYCAIENCESALDCPEGATCVTHDDGVNYCFRECADKPECNANRDLDSEANCSGSFDYADPSDSTSGLKACIPPSSGTK